MATVWPMAPMAVPKSRVAELNPPAVQDVPSPDDPANWKFQVVTSRLATPSDTFESASDEERLRDLKSRAANLAEPFRSAVQWIPNGTKVSTNNIAFWHPVPFSGETSGEASGREASSVGAGGGGRGGRATLAGDAAHPMPPHRGQGLNHAICDAFNLVGALEEVRDGVKEMEEAIRSYSDEVVKRGAEEVQISCMNARMFLDWEMLRESPIMKRGLDRHSGEGRGEVNGDGARA
jgi:2-polyprenyl-6-methoxyphenol hydroxylase-like FAD-dependent oxidoreductase